MRGTRPKVRLISKPQIDWGEIQSYLDEVGGLKWFYRVKDEAGNPLLGLNDGAGEVLLEFSGRMCYRAWDVGLNRNVTKVREDSNAYFENLLASGHGSVLEHANYTFVFQDVSRVFTHELVRHRAGVAISQESLRYVRLTDIPFRVPEELLKVVTMTEIEELITLMEKIQQRAGEELDRQNLPMQEKKVLTSAMRRLAPLGLSTSVVWTANVRALRHVIKMRTAPDAEEEMRYVFKRVGFIMKEECPNLFQDFQLEKDTWVPEHVKV